MTSHLYWISTITYVIMLLVILINDILSKKNPNEVEKAFRLMVIWVIFFCGQDTIWGMCENQVIKGDWAFFWSSTVFHSATVLTTFFWLNYVLIYLNNKIKQRIIYLAIDGGVIFFEFVLVIANFFYPILFRIKSGAYVTETFRPLSFFNQYIVYLVIGVYTLVLAIKEKDKGRERYWSVFAFEIAPLIMGLLQLIYPDAPFYSMGYFLGCFIVHIFVVAKDREEATRNELVLRSNHDRLTGLLNRRAFEEDLFERREGDLEENLIYASMDVDGLKVINDTLGHEAGDELLKGAAECMKKCLGAYGKVYRTGGDEFNAIIFALSSQLETIKHDLKEELSKRKGKYFDSISVSCGFVEAKELEESSIHKLSVLAEERMSKEKERYYKEKGVDRRGQKEAHTALCGLYTKILKINITKDDYQIINVDEAEQNSEKEYDKRISQWLIDFAETGQVHPEDLQEYQEKTALSYMRNYFFENKKSLCIIYRRKYNERYRKVLMEIIPARDYEVENQNLYLYVKPID